MVRLRSPAPILRHMGEFPSGQRGQTVNLLSLTSLVRIQLPPPNKKDTKRCPFCLPAKLFETGFALFVRTKSSKQNRKALVRSFRRKASRSENPACESKLTFYNARSTHESGCFFSWWGKLFETGFALFARTNSSRQNRKALVRSFRRKASQSENPACEEI